MLIGLIGASGSGKSYSAFRLASGICGDKSFAVIDTEAGRALHYADQFRFDHGDLTAPFRPERYLEAIVEADKHGYPVIIVDSLSHEHAGEGGLLDWHEEELNRLSGADYKKREAYNMMAWIKVKMAHKHFMQRLLQVRAHLILCFRAEERIEVTYDEKGKLKITPKASTTGLHGWIPICEKNTPYELTCSFLLTGDQPGYPKPIKLQAQHREFFTLDQPITEASGARLAEWARGGSTSPVPHLATRVVSTDQPTPDALLAKIAPWKDDRDALFAAFGTRLYAKIERMSVAELSAGLENHEALVGGTGDSMPHIVGEEPLARDLRAKLIALAREVDTKAVTDTEEALSHYPEDQPLPDTVFSMIEGNLRARVTSRLSGEQTQELMGNTQENLIESADA
jgi:hypothetical protein